MSKTRERFVARKKERRETRKRAAWEAAHTFWCQGQRRRRGKLRDCLFEVRFQEEAAGARAVCGFCKQLHFYVTPDMGPGIMRSKWVTAETFKEIYIPNESLRVDNVYTEIEVEKKTPAGSPEVKERLVIADHAPWCGSPDVILAGLTAKIGGPGRVRWRDSKGIIRHNCVSSEAARRHAAARWV